MDVYCTRVFEFAYFEIVSCPNFLSASCLHFTGKKALLFDTVHPFVQEATNTQNLNRYTYVLNNPLGYTDPSGYFWEKLKPFAGVITSLALIHFTGGFDASWFTASWQGAATAGAISGAVGAAVNGGDILTGGLTGAFSGAAFYAIGQTFTGAAGTSLAKDGFHHVFAHGFTGGLLATIQGGKFGHGFVSAGLTKAINVNDLVPGIDEGLNEVRVILAALVGGSVSAVTGGKFANGATTAAIGQAFNGNSFWRKAKIIGEVALEYLPGGALAQCALKGCGYFDWAMAIVELAPPAKLFKLATKIAKGDLGAIDKLRSLDTKVPETSCFTAGTLIHTKDGFKPIEDIEVGDMVAAKSDQTGEMEYKPVVRLFRHDNKTVLNLTFETQNGEQELIQATPEHPFMLESGQWKNAEQLIPGDTVQTTDSGEMVKLKAVVTDDKRHTVYNFEVKDFHTYFVGEHGVWVHNDCDKFVDPHSLERTHSLSGKGSSKRVDNISQSMRDNGYIGDGIDVVEHQGKRYVIDGHHRLVAAKRTGTNVKINIVKDIPNHHSDFNSVQDVVQSAEFVGLDNLRPPRRR